MSQFVKSGYWRLVLQARIARLRIQSSHAGSPTVIDGYLDAAAALSTGVQSPSEWWFGSKAEAAWMNLRLAEEALVLATTDAATIRAQGLGVLAHAKGRLADGDVRVTELKSLLAANGSAVQSIEISRVAHSVAVASHDVSDRQHRDQREFRNRLRLLVMSLAVLSFVLAVAALFRPMPEGWVPTPQGATSQGHAIAGALALGAIGALFSAIPALSEMPANSTTFNPVLEQALLKIVVGAWSAVVGLVVVTAGLKVDAVSDLVATTPAGFAMMCALFGAMQEALTRFADTKAAAAKPQTSA